MRLGLLPRDEPHVDPLPQTINLVVLVSRLFSRASQKHINKLVFVTTNRLDSSRTTKRNNNQTTINLSASKTKQQS